MNESAWRNACDPEPLLALVRGTMSARRLRLFACACCRGVWHLLTDPRCRQAVEVAEAFADGLVGPRELGVAHGDAWRVLARNNSRKLEEAAVRATEEDAGQAALQAALWSAWALWKASALPAQPGTSWDPFRPPHVRGPCPMPSALEQACLALRDIVEPYQKVIVAPEWLTWNSGTVRQVALGIYTDRDFPRLAVLADALEDAGCDDAILLNHLRSPGPHFRGCWALDAVLGRS